MLFSVCGVDAAHLNHGVNLQILATQAGRGTRRVACAGFDFRSGSPTARNTNHLDNSHKRTVRGKISSVLTSCIQTTYLLLDKFLVCAILGFYAGPPQCLPAARLPPNIQRRTFQPANAACASRTLRRDSLSSIPFVYRGLRTLLHNRALATPLESIASALFPIQLGVGGLNRISFFEFRVSNSLRRRSPESRNTLQCSLQVCSFVFNQLQDAPPANPFLSSFCIVAGGWVYPKPPPA
jgi:hypothetical protein